MIQFKWQDPRLDISCQNMKCNKKLFWYTGGWIWSWKGETFCSNTCRLARKRQYKLRHYFYSSGNFDYSAIVRTYLYWLSKYLNPFEWLKRG